MTKGEFIFSCIPGLEQDLDGAKNALDAADEALFKDWAKPFTIFPEAMLRELWEIERKKRDIV